MKSLKRIASALERIADALENRPNVNSEKVSKYDCHRRRWQKGEDEILLNGWKRREDYDTICERINSKFHTGRTRQAAQSRMQNIKAK